MVHLKSAWCIHTTLNNITRNINPPNVPHTVCVLAFSLKAKLCLHVVKDAFANYINVAMI